MVRLPASKDANRRGAVPRLLRAKGSFGQGYVGFLLLSLSSSPPSIAGKRVHRDRWGVEYHFLGFLTHLRVRLDENIATLAKNQNILIKNKNSFIKGNKRRDAAILELQQKDKLHDAKDAEIEAMIQGIARARKHGEDARRDGGADMNDELLIEQLHEQTFKLLGARAKQ